MQCCYDGTGRVGTEFPRIEAMKPMHTALADCSFSRSPSCSSSLPVPVPVSALEPFALWAAVPILTCSLVSYHHYITLLARSVPRGAGLRNTLLAH